MTRLFAAIAAILFACLAASFAAENGLTPAASKAYLAAHAYAPGVTVRPSGLQIKILKNGMGRRYTPGDTAQIYYTTRLINGAVIDGTEPNLPVSVEAGGTLRGVGEALQQMREGDHWELTVPPSLAFGDKGAMNGTVPPEQALVFDITLVAATPPAHTGVGPQDGLSFAGGNREGHAYWTIHQ